MIETKYIKPYSVDILNGHTVTFINGFKARNIKGFLWLWTNLFSIIKSVKKAHGCFECIPCIVSPVRVLMISYWINQDELNTYFKSSKHKKLMNFFFNNPKSLALFNEKYIPKQSGLYHNEPQGLAKHFLQIT